MCDEEYLDDDNACEETFSYIPSLPGQGEYEEGKSEYGDLDDEDFDIDF